MDSKNNYKVIGLMSGTSLDGLDIAFCHFIRKPNGWKHAIVKAETIPYPSNWKKTTLRSAPVVGRANCFHGC